MAQFLAHFRKQPSEALDYSVDYSQWLASGETISNVVVSISPATVPALAVSAVALTGGNTIANFTVSAGTDSQQYQVTLLTTTTNAQVVEREILYTVEEL